MQLHDTNVDIDVFAVVWLQGDLLEKRPATAL